MDILEAFSKNGFTKSAFSFIKRKGRIVTQYFSTKATFAYIQREETNVDENTRAWIDVTYFDIRIGKEKEFRVDTWGEVMKNLDHWLKHLKDTPS